MTERFSNNAQTTLAVAALAGDATIQVWNAGSFPNSGNFRVLVDEEYMLVTGVSGTTFTVTRGIEGSSAVGHSLGATVTQLLTAGGLAQTIADNVTSGGQNSVTLVNGLNSNIATGGRSSIRLAGPSASFSVGGFAAPASAGAYLTIVNTTTQAMTIVHEDASSTAANRIDTQSGVPVNLQVGRKQSCTFIYDSTSSRWVLQNAGFAYPLNINVKDFGAYGDGSHDDTAAIQAALNVASGTANTASVEIYFPSGTYLINSSLTYTGNVTGSVRLRGHKAGYQGGSIIAWHGSGSGATARTMLHMYGANQCEVDNLVWNANYGNSQPTPASFGVWLHYDVSNNTGSSNIFFNDCQFLFFEGTGGYQDSAGVGIGDNGATTEVNGVYFDYCTFTGNATSYPNHVPFAQVVCLQQNVGNSEIFHFRGCQFQYGQFGYFCLGGNNPVSFTDGTQFEGFAQACIWTDQTALVYCQGCDVETGNSAAQQGIFVRGGTLTTVHLDSCEVVIKALHNDTLSMPSAYVTGGVAQWSHPQSGMLIVAGGPLVVENSILDATGGLGGNPQPCISAGNLSATGFGAVTVRNCLVQSTSNQVLIYDNSGNKLTTAFTTQRYAITLRGNKGGPGFGLLPDYDGAPATQGALGPYYMSIGGNQPTPIYQAEPRATTTCYEVDFNNGALAVSATSATLLLAQLKAKTIVLRVFLEVLTPFSGGAVSACHVKLGNSASATDQYLLSYDVFTPATNPAGMSDSDLGAGLAKATAVQGGDPSQWKVASSDLQITFTSVGANLNALTAGALRVYLTTEQVLYP